MGEGSNRRVAVAVLGSLAFVVLLLLIAENSFNLKFLATENTGSILLFTAISALSFLLFLTLFVLLLRNILKLYASEQSRVLGSRLRTRMLLGALLLSVAPALFMLFFNYLLMNRSIDRWFSQPVVQIRTQSMQVVMEMSHYASSNARAEAESLASGPELGTMGVPGREQTMLNLFHQHRVTLQGGFVLIFQDGNVVDEYQIPQLQPEITLLSGIAPEERPERLASAADFPAAILRAAERTDDPVLRIGRSSFILGAASSQRGLLVVVGLPLPTDIAVAMHEIETGTEHYWALLRARRRVRQTYLLVLLLLTGLTLFVSSWLALFLSKQITRPVEALADAMDAMASGNYGSRVDFSAAGELGELIRSFNHMATDLQTSRIQLETSTQQLSHANSAIDERRRELETVLETIPSGVATLDKQLRILQANRAFCEMLDPMGEAAIEGQPIQTLFSPDAAMEITRVLRRSRRLPSASAEIEANDSRGTLHLIITVTRLRGSLEGHLVVMDNVTDVLRAQKQMAWKEVAQRVAHEIKNPLTPIALSAERIERHLDRGLNQNSVSMLLSATSVIRSSVQTLRQLVDQFAALADFPAARPEPTDLNSLMESTLALFAGRLEGVDVRLHLTPNMPAVMADAEALKRAVSNLIDNAAEAMQQSLLRVLNVQTGWNEAQSMAEIVIADTGHGITEEIRERLFLPFFSTRRRGTGLGLSIAAKIVQEHQGSIRVEKNTPAGARFIVEIPLAEHATSPEAIPRFPFEATR
ncbi:MAG TPA: ATP-binding protein [Acidobacteriaceae bacterium]|nr:ATP-binding protein [Acidobacteriaceae bacterium]